MRGSWTLRDWEADYLKTLIANRIADLDNRRADTINLTEEDVCPENIIDVLEMLGYEYDEVDTNGWEQDTWINFIHQETGHGATLFYCGRTFEMKLYLAEKEEFV
jgi:hypothetical protein